MSAFRESLSQRTPFACAFVCCNSLSWQPLIVAPWRGQVGFRVSSARDDFTDSIVLLLSHSGGTFSTVAVSNILKGFTSHIFAVTSEWDTQLGRSVRQKSHGISAQNKLWRDEQKSLGSEADMEADARVFTTFTGVRPAEACSVTVVAMHQVLTNLLLFVMYSDRFYGGTQHGEFRVQEVVSPSVSCPSHLLHLRHVYTYSAVVGTRIAPSALLCRQVDDILPT